MRNAIMRQAKSAAAESAIKMTVYQADSTGDSEVAQPAESAPEEPVKRPSAKKAEAVDVEDHVDVIKKWTKKG